MTPARRFEKRARAYFTRHYRRRLVEGTLRGVAKKFDMISSNGKIVGEAKYFTLVQGEYEPPAKYSIIAEHVWLLEKTKARTKFLVFGKDRRVAAGWLKKYGKLVKGVRFFFLKGERLETLHPSRPVRRR